MEKKGRIVVMAIVFLLVGFGAGLFWGKSQGRTELIVEAVANNYGHYKITNDLGQTQFEWGPAPAGYPLIPPPKR